MDRFVSGRYSKLIALGGGLFGASFCGGYLLSEFAFLIVHDDNTPAAYPGLAGKRVATSFAVLRFNCNMPIPCCC